MANTLYMGLLLIIANFATSYYGFRNPAFFDKYKFDIDGILVHKEYVRLISSGFLHVGWIHLIFNMISLYSFSDMLELRLGVTYFFIIYFTSLIGGNLFALFIHRNHGDYASVGASGAVCGVIFSTIVLYPGSNIQFFGIPFNIPGPLFALAFALYSIYGIKSNKDNIGHEAHLGGALIGMLVAVLAFPQALKNNLLPILAVFVPSLLFIVIIILRPEFLLIDNYFFFKRKTKNDTVDHRYNARKLDRQKELDKLLDKISKSGMESLTAKEKQKLKEYSK